MDYEISYLSLLHGIAIGACLMLAVTHLTLLLGSNSHAQRRVFFASTVMTLAAGIAIYAELLKALATDIEGALTGLMLEIIPVFALLAALLFFVRWYFNYRWDAWFIAALIVWTGAHIYQFAFYPDSFYSEIHGLIPLETAWGEAYSKLSATAAAGKYVADLGTAMILVYIVGAARHAWRQGDRRRALIVGGASVGFIVVAGILVPLDDIGLLKNTMALGLPFLGIVAALTYQLVDDRAISHRLRIEVEQLRRSSLAGEIAAGLMHELNQPLTSILSNSQAARRFLQADEPDLDEVREALDDVIAEDKRAAGIINGLRGLLRQEQVDVSGFDANESIRRVAALLAGELHTTGTRLNLSLHPSPIVVEASQVQIEQVLMNLAQNSIRALKQVSKPERNINVTSDARDGTAILAVADSGPGIPEHLATEVFDPFKSGAGSLGMGLAICRRIATAHGGKIWHETSELGGAKFVFSLPLGGTNRPDD